MAHLAIVPPPDAARAAPPRKRRGPSPALSLTTDEARHLRAAVRGLVRSRYGTLTKLARALNVAPQILTRSKHPAAALAVALWRETGIPLEVLLRGGVAVVPSGGSSRPTRRRAPCHPRQRADGAQPRGSPCPARAHGRRCAVMFYHRGSLIPITAADILSALASAPPRAGVCGILERAAGRALRARIVRRMDALAAAPPVLAGPPTTRADVAPPTPRHPCGCTTTADRIECAGPVLGGIRGGWGESPCPCACHAAHERDAAALARAEVLREHGSGPYSAGREGTAEDAVGGERQAAALRDLDPDY